MFGPMKEALRGRFSCAEEVIGAVQNWLKTEPRKLFFLTDLENLCNTGIGRLKSFLYIYNKCAFF
jgi:hypothetical protein